MQHRHLQDNLSRWLYPTKTMKIVGAVSFLNDGPMTATLAQYWNSIGGNFLCKCLLGPSKKRISPWTTCCAFHVDKRMEAENYKDIKTWLYLHRYQSRDTDTWWCTTLCFLGRLEDWILFLQICRDMMQSSPQTRNSPNTFQLTIDPMLF